MGTYTTSLAEIGLDDLRQTGGKGGNLGHLTQAGFPVPPGFCILSHAYEDFLSHTDLKRRIQEVAASLDFSDLEAVEKEAARIRQEMLATPLPEAIEEEMVSAYRELLSGAGEDRLVAVRSSVGTKDLASTSFPGQMDTYHNLKGEAEVMGKVRECWASAFSYKAVVNRDARGIGHFDVFVAPLVQLMVDSDSAGVIFTVNPSNNRPDQMVINACFGLGEGVVSGELECDHLVVDKDSDEILEEEIGDKEFKIVLDARQGSGNLKMPLPEDERSRPSLTAEQISELVEMARAIEAHYDTPQDIEWAFQDDKLYVLQSRKVTGLGDVEQAAEEWVSEFDSTIDPDYDYYTLSNISEVLPDVLTPLSMSDIDSLDHGFLKTNTDLGLMKGIDPKSELTFLGLFYGRAHINLSVVKAMLSKIPGSSATEFERRAPEDIEEEGFRPTFRSIIALPGIFAHMIYKAMVTPREAETMGRVNDERIAREKQMDFESMPYDQVVEWIVESRGNMDRAMVMHITASQFSVTYYDSLSKKTEKWLGDTEGMLASRLVTGLQDLESARPSALIWDLSRLVKDSPELTGIFEVNEPPAILDLLEGSESAGAREFLESLSSFLGEFGYRSVNEAEVMLPNWSDDPSYVFAIIKNYLDADPSSSPHNLSLRQEKEREEAVREAMDRLKGSQRLQLRYALKQAQKYIALREFMKGILIKGIAQGKMVYHILSRRFAGDGIIREPEDLFFLTNREIKALALGEGGDIPVEELVTRRRREYERNQMLVLPEYTRGRPRPLSPKELEVKEDIEVLSGIAVSPGRVTGRARVITNPRRNAELKPGEILVAPVTDAAWTPLFVTAKAIVVDVGGPLSHGSIVAREFGIPGVLNVGVATRLVKTGQVITVDGNHGKVYLHPPEGDVQPVQS